MDKDKPQQPEAVKRAEKEWDEMERDVKQEAHDLVKHTASRAEDEDSSQEA